MVKNAIESWWQSPPVDDPPARSVNDWIIVGVLITASFVEALFLRPELWSKPLAILLSVGPIVALLWRRTHPLPVVFLAFSVHAGSELIPRAFGEQEIFLYSGLAYALIIPYSLFRWGSGRHGAIGLVFIVATHLTSHPLSVADAAAVVGFFLFPAEVGASVRYRVSARAREVEQIKHHERQEIARELHDTVAHHVSAIVIRAQAGRVQAGTDPGAAVAALSTIEQEASLTLMEMRTMVGVLRSGDSPDLAPQRGLADIADLARAGDDGPRISVNFSGNTEETTPSVGAALYRVAQEAITNSLRHSRRAQHISVLVDGGTEHVRLSVQDDGEFVGGSRTPAGIETGYGVIGMQERAKLLGGTLEAGPADGRGWKVEATLPRLAR